MSCIFNQLSHLMVQVQEDAGFKRNVLLVGLIDALALVFFTTLAYFYYRWWSNHPLYGKNKGPKVYPLVGSVIPFLRNKHRRLEHTYETLSKTPGHTSRVVRPGRGAAFFTANPTNVEHILKTNFENYRKGEYWNENLRELLGDGIFNADDYLWKIQRKVASHEFTTRSLRDFVLDSAVRETSDRLLPFLHQASQSGHVFDLQDILARFAFDNICQLAFGVDPACLDISLPRVRFAEAFDQATLLSMRRLQAFPRFMWKVKAALKIGEPQGLKRAVAVIDEFAMGVIKNRREELAVASVRGDHKTLGGRTDLLSRFIALMGNEEEGEGEIVAELSKNDRKYADKLKSRGKYSSSDVFLRDIVISFVLAGRDTTTSALSWFFWVLSSHPEVELAIVDEVSRVVKARSPPNAESVGDERKKNRSTLSYEELKNMHYLHAALMESMRLYPPVPGDMKVARKADVWPDGTVVPANALAIYHPYTMGRLEELWGKDALQFKPERWLKEGMFVPQSPYKYTVFQAGPRVCLGKDMVLLQMKLVCAAIIPNFEICIPQDYKPQYETALTMRLRNGLPVRVRNRMTPV
ncbi:unnamed protein product [Calypogeia fissa]